jgi:hypothetical protein
MGNKAREINSPVIKQLIDETTPEELAKIDTEMANNKQQTAVEWLQSTELERDLTLADWKQAKEMAKEQAIRLHYEYELYVMMNESVVMTFGQFYKQTYGGGEQ